jgi:peptide methionine sulfoxide reductase msrA/msrB
MSSWRRAGPDAILPALLALTAALLAAGCGHDEAGDMSTNRELTAAERLVIVDKGTERPFSGLFVHHDAPGTYTCKRCGADLYRSRDKFDSGCGWPAFDEEIEGAVRRVPDADGARTEISCAACGAHLGHVFEGEGLTSKNVRHCVNSVSMGFVPGEEEHRTRKAVFASGCFWGTEYFLARAPGVIATTVGYTGGLVERPSYERVCTGTTGHVEAVEVVYDPARTTYEELARLFFETHDPTQRGGQGPDVGDQYRSVVFYSDPAQEAVARRLIAELEAAGLDVATEVLPAGPFWEAEGYHQDYYERKGGAPYCHRKVKRFR